MTALVGAMAGINMISGAGMLDFLACQSVEKLVIDAEGIAMVRRLFAGIRPRGDSLAAELLAITGHRGNFLELKHTRQWFKVEQHLPSEVIDRGSVRSPSSRRAEGRGSGDGQGSPVREQVRGSAAPGRRELEAGAVGVVLALAVLDLPDLERRPQPEEGEEGTSGVFGQLMSKSSRAQPCGHVAVEGKSPASHEDATRIGCRSLSSRRRQTDRGGPRPHVGTVGIAERAASAYKGAGHVGRSLTLGSRRPRPHARPGRRAPRRRAPQKLFGENAEEFLARLDAMDERAEAKEQKDLVTAIRASYQRYAALVNKEFQAEGLMNRAPDSKKQELIDEVTAQIGRLNEVTQRSLDRKMIYSQQVSRGGTRIALFFTIIAVACGAGFGIIITRSLYIPLRRLKEGTQDISSGNLSKKIAIDSRDEIGELSASFNQMCDRLRELDQLKSDFISNITHDLKTPLASLTEANHLLLEGVAGTISPDQKHLLRIIKEDAARLIRLIESMIDL